MLSQLFRARPGAREKSGADHAGMQYIFKASLAGGAKQLAISDAGLTVQATSSQVWPLQRIAAIRLSYRPASMQPWRFRADIENDGGQCVKVFSTTWHSISQMARQDDEYRAFIVELHRRLAITNDHVQLTAGINPLLYALGLVVVSLIGIAVAALFIRALITSEFAGALFLAGFAGWFTWQIGGFMRRNRPRRYTFNHLPMDVLP